MVVVDGWAGASLLPQAVHDRLVENLLQVVLRQRRALDVAARAALRRETPRLHLGHWTLPISETGHNDFQQNAQILHNLLLIFISKTTLSFSAEIQKNCIFKLLKRDVCI